MVFAQPSDGICLPLGFGVGKVTTELARSYCDPVYDGGSDVEALIGLIDQ